MNIFNYYTVDYFDSIVMDLKVIGDYFNENNCLQYILESINDIINTQTEKQLSIAQSHLDGSLSKIINSWRDEIINMSSLIESLLDFSDEDIPKELSALFLKKLKKKQGGRLSKTNIRSYNL